MNPAAIKEEIKRAHSIRRPVMVWGSPGVGKSSIFAQCAAEMKIQFLNLKLSIRSPLDFQIPVVQKDGGVKIVAPDTLPVSGRGLLLLDELPNSDDELQKLALELALERRIGGYSLPDGWSVHAAGNRVKDLAGANRLLSSLNLRFIHLDYDTDLDEWSIHALNHEFHETVVAFIRTFPQHLDAFNPKERSSPTPRGWEYVSDEMKAGLPSDRAYEVCSGIVGPAVAAEFVQFARVYEGLPSIPEIIKNPKTAPLVSGPGNLFLVSRLLVKAVARNPRSLTPVLEYIQRFPVESGEFGTLVISLLRKRAKEEGWEDKLTSNKQYAAWCIEQGI